MSREGLVMDVLRTLKRRLRRCRVALIISLAGNIVMAAVLIFR